MSTSAPHAENRLARETSPYLLQHKPILLSVGYAACHWCHVMAHESFEDDATAAQMNDLFVNIKVDREERPDIDAIYMRALHSLGEQGGWPLTMFLDSEARPFWGGTYFPPEPRFGRPSFKHVLAEVARIYREEPDKISHNAGLLVQALGERERSDAQPNIKDAALADLTKRMVNAVDMQRGGLSGAPKFPQWSFFWLLWRGAIRYGDDNAKRAVDVTLANICQGGIYDHLGGGFARYSVDERWLAPHFEKMLYDNALLIDLMCEAYREDSNDLYKARIEETVEWLQRVVSQPRSMPTAKARKASSTSGPNPRSPKCSARPMRKSSPKSTTSPMRATGKATPSSTACTRSTCAHPRRRLPLPPCAPGFSHAAPAASAPAGTTRCWPTGTA
jgi:uncharacterized protein YyaL (SSP411 family)